MSAINAAASERRRSTWSSSTSARAASGVVSTTAHPGEGSPIPFYESYGFVRTGDLVFDGEVLLELRLR